MIININVACPDRLSVPPRGAADHGGRRRRTQYYVDFCCQRSLPWQQKKNMATCPRWPPWPQWFRVLCGFALCFSAISAPTDCDHLVATGWVVAGGWIVRFHRVLWSGDAPSPRSGALIPCTHVTCLIFHRYPILPRGVAISPKLVWCATTLAASSR